MAYTYTINSQSLSSLDERDNNYHGIFVKGILLLQPVPVPSGALSAQITDLQYAEVNATSENNCTVADDKNSLHWMDFKISNNTFGIILNDGLVQKLLMKYNTSVDEANMIRAVVSQLQVDLQGKTKISSPTYYENYHSDNKTKLFSTLEESITGYCETIYNISPLPKSVIKKNYKLAPLLNESSDLQNITDVLKITNFNNCWKSIIYSSGMNGKKSWNAGYSNIGEALGRKSEARLIIDGNFENYTIHSSVRREEVLISPSLHKPIKAVVLSCMNLKLLSMEKSEHFPSLFNETETTLLFDYKIAKHTNITTNSLNKTQNATQSIHDVITHIANGEIRKQRKVRDTTTGSTTETPSTLSADNATKASYNLTTTNFFETATKTSLTKKNSTSNITETSTVSSITLTTDKNSVNEEEQLPTVATTSVINNTSSQAEKLHTIDNIQNKTNQSNEVKLLNVSTSLQKPLLTSLHSIYLNMENKSIPTAQEIQHTIKMISEKIAFYILDFKNIINENILNAFCDLTTIISNVDYTVLHNVSSRMYQPPSENENKQYLSWVVFRDAVAQAGTGPALMLIKEWILYNKTTISDIEKIIGQLPNSVEVINEEYIDTLFNMVVDPLIGMQQPIRTSLILALTNILHKEFENDHFQRSRQQIHIFTPKIHHGSKLKEVYLPYLERQLKYALSRNDDIQVHVYIKALGNIGHPEVLNIFKAHLYSGSQMTNFQKVFLIMCLEKMTTSYPAEIQNFLYPIYIDKNQNYEIRCAAVFQIMRTKPPLDILHKMAELTHFESSNQIIAAVKSSLHSAAQATNPEDDEFKQNAKSVIHLLNPKKLGLQYSHQWHFSHKLSQLGNLGFTYVLNSIGSDKNIFPKGVFGISERFFGGLSTGVEYNGVMFADIKKVISILANTWPVVKKGEGNIPSPPEEKNIENSNKSKNIHSLPNSTNQDSQNQENKYFEADQPESLFLFQLENTEKLITFGRNYSASIENWLQQKLKLLKTGFKFNHNKLFQRDKFLFTVPNVAGFITQIAYSVPTIHHLTGKLKLNIGHNTRSSISLKQIPEKFALTGKLNFGYALNKFTDVRFVMPLNGKQYNVGYKEQVLINMPITVNTTINSKDQTKDILIKFAPNTHSTVGFYSQYNSQQYKYQNNLTDIFRKCDTGKEKINGNFTNQFVKESKGIHFNASISSIKNELLTFQNNSFSNLYYLNNLQEKLKSLINTNITFRADFPSERSSVSFHMLYDEVNNYNTNHDEISSKSEQKLRKFSVKDEQFLLRNNAALSNKNAIISELKVLLDEEKIPTYLANLSYNWNDFANETNFQFKLLGKSTDKDCQHCQLQPMVSFNLNSSWSRVPIFNFSKAAIYNPKSELKATLQTGTSKTMAAAIQCNFKRSATRINYLMEETITKICKDDMEEGNLIMPPCQLATKSVNYFDQHNCTFKIASLKKEISKFYTLALNTIQLGNQLSVFYPQSSTGPSNQISFKTQLSPNFETANISISFPDITTELKNITVHSVLQPILEIHPMYSMVSRISQAFLARQQNPTCALDKTKLNTFDNRTYPITLGKCWYVAMALTSAFTANLKLGESDLLVLVRDNNEGRIVRILAEDNIIDITNQQPNEYVPYKYVHVNKKQFRLASDKLTSIALNGQNNNKFYGTVEHEKIKIYFTNLSIIFDGLRLMVTTSNTFQNQTLGLCGTFNGEDSDDFILPNGCNANDPRKFSSSYAIVNNNTCFDESLKWATDAINRSCSLTSDIFINTEFPKNVSCHNDEHKVSDPRCLKRYIQVEQDYKYTCFSQRELPKCKASCYPTEIVKKNVNFYCISNAIVAKQFVSNIKTGKLHDFSSKQTTKTLTVDIPIGCYKC